MKYIGLAICALLLAVSCSDPREDVTPAARAAGGRPVIYTVNYPLQYFADRIGGDRVEVQFPAPADEDPAYWTPDGDTVSAFQKADLILLNGASYAKWVDKVSLPGSRLVDTASAMKDQFIATEGDLTHTHGPGGEHAHGGVAFTTWLDPQLAVAQARAVKEALVRVLPEDAGVLEKGFEGLAEDLLELDRLTSSFVSGKPGEPLIFSHPVYQYLARRYDLRSESVHWEPDEAPTEEMWRELETLLQEHPARWMVWEGQPQEATASRLLDLGVRSIVFDPCGNVPDKGDYLAVMQQNNQNLKAAFAP